LIIYRFDQHISLRLGNNDKNKKLLDQKETATRRSEKATIARSEERRILRSTHATHQSEEA
jgi:hypothetical protein